MSDMKLIQVFNDLVADKIMIEESYAHLLSKKFPKDPTSWKIYAFTLIKKKKFKKSLSILETCILLDNSQYFAYYLLGTAQKKLKMYQESISNFEKSLNLNSSHYESLCHLGDIFMIIGNYKMALNYFLSSLKINPNNYKILISTGIINRQLGYFEDALSYFEKASELNGNVESFTNLASTYRSLSNYDQAKKYYKKVIKLNPEFANAYYGLATVLYHNQNLEETIYYLQQATDYDRSYLKAFQFLSRLLLSSRGFEKEYADLINKWLVPNEYNIKSYKKTWNGENKLIILVRKVRDVGDQLVYSSLLPDLHSISKKVIVECDKRFFDLYKRSFPKNIIYIENAKNYENLNEIDREVPIQNLLYYFRKSTLSYKKSAYGYLIPNQKYTNILKDRLKKGTKKTVIGISWKTFSKIPGTSKRNLKLENLINHIYDENKILINLQYGDVQSELDNIKKKLNVTIEKIKEIDCFSDIDSLSSLISACDYVVTIQGFAAHLAGSLGVNTKLLLSYSPSEFWGLEMNESYFYQSVKIYRQSSPDDWHKPLQDLKKDLLN